MLGVIKSASSSHRLIIIHAGGNNGFVPNAGSIFKSRSTTGDYHGQMNTANFEKWITEKLLPNLPEKSVIIMDNAPYHSTQINKPPSKYARKSEMIDWFIRNDVIHSESMTKYELSQLIERHRKPEKTYKIDEIIKSNGHDILRLPPYMCELNSIELIWAHIKRKIREKNPSTLTFSELHSLTEGAIATITTDDWEKNCNVPLRRPSTFSYVEPS
uniref:uncharacterized protein LOC117611096 n=1 Tax=Osmia lignaria TaxID=473952 RepID=UPI001478EA34|nr:uncharacterized protein LOC117611096 [Osmia lignaria]